ncbi:sulfide-quinone oxidoreductase [Heliocybe sulcata]|uniref:Sulfide:quinone oxidoreductase, mitochondrial n=1 Tax=Heliocybe sulcata TaxID=5364 RepID=A0A5C3NB94_9AGAM|nr:sulfide-quinone oxidoreductase [Heliocybe sulcata]
MLSVKRTLNAFPQVSRARWAHTASDKDKYKIVVVGGGSAGLTVANQIYNRFRSAGKALNADDIAILDAAEFHHYQPGWTLVGSGLKQKHELRRSLSSLIPPHLAHVPENVQSFNPSANSLTTTSGRTLSYDTLVVATGLKVNYDAISGLSQGLSDPKSGVSTIYSYDFCDKVWRDIEGLRSGKAVFTQPAGIIKCAGAPQKIMWMAWDRFQKTGRGGNTQVEFYTGTPTMFGVKKYSDALNELRLKRGIPGQFQHNLTSIDVPNHKATFTKADGSTAAVDYDILHVVPPQGPLDFMKGQPIADAAGWVEVNKETLRHVKPEFGNVWALGDCTTLPTSKTAAAITKQAPILTENLFSVMDTGKTANAKYNGYTSCPLLTGYGQLMLAEFKYDAIPEETFAEYFGDQAQPRRLYYHLKKDLFPWAYFNYMVKGQWFGTSGIIRPSFPALE